MHENYIEAVAFAERFLASQIQNGNLNTHKVEPSEFIYMFGLGIEHCRDDHASCPSFYRCSENALLHLYSQARTDKGAYDIACRITTAKLFRGEPLSEAQSMFAGMVVGGILKCPPPEGKRITETFALNVNLILLAQILAQNFDLKLTRNDEGMAQASACDAVSEALTALGVAKSPRAIKELLVHKSSARAREVVDAIKRYKKIYLRDDVPIGLQREPCSHTR